MSSEKEFEYIKKATVFDLMCILDGSCDKTYTAATVKQLLKAYAIGCGSYSSEVSKDKGIAVCQKAVIYDLQRIIEDRPNESYTATDLTQLLEAYITGVPQ